MQEETKSVENEQSQAAFKPEDLIVDDRSKEQDEFDKAFDELFDESDGEDKSTEDHGSEGDGQTQEPAPKTEETTPTDDGQEPTVDGTDTARETPATGSEVNDGIDYRVRSEELAELLAKEQQRTSTWNGRIKAANAKAEAAESRVKELEAEINKLKTAAPAEKPAEDFGDEELDTFFEDFPEMKKPFEIMLKKAVGNHKVVKETTTKEPATDVMADAPGDDTITDGQKLFEETVGTAHPDWRYHITTGKLKAWIETQEDYIKPTLLSVYQSGTAQACIDLLTNYKKSTGLIADDGARTTTKSDPKADKQKKLDSLREVRSSSTKVDPTKSDKRNASFDDTAKEIGL